jgi:hypothetical protein
VKSYVESIAAGTLPGVVGGAHTVWYFGFVGLALVAAMVSRLRGSPTSPRAARACLGLFVATVATPTVLMIFNELLGRFAPQSDLLNLLYDYYKPHAVYLSPWLQCVLTTMPWMLSAPFVLSRRVFSLLALTVTTGLVVSLSLFSVPALKSHRNANKHWRLGWDELQAIEHLNTLVPKNEAVLIPAVHWQTPRSEHVLSADGREGMIVPHLTTRLLFGVRLGTSKDYGWRDLDERLCGSPDERRRLLREANVRWTVLRRKDVRARATFDEFTWPCGLKLRDLAEYPAVWSEGDLALFRIRP